MEKVIANVEDLAAVVRKKNAKEQLEDLQDVLRGTLDILKEAVARSTQQNAFGGPNAVLQNVHRAIKVLTEAPMPHEEDDSLKTLECGASNQTLLRRNIRVTCSYPAGHPNLHGGQGPNGQTIQWDRGR